MDLSAEPADLDALMDLAGRAGVELPADYVDVMGRSDGGDGDVGSRWLELWPVAQIAEAASGEPRYDGVLLFAGNGANTIYGFDARRSGAVIEGDWIGLNRDELIPRGTSFTAFLASLAASDLGDDEEA